MDPNLTTLNPVTTNQIAHAHFHPTLESGGNAVNFSPQFLTCDEQYANASNAEYPSFKKPRTSQTPVNLRIPASFNKPNMGIPFKNVPCLQFRRGHCTYGDNCQYSHGIVDTTQKILPRREELMSNETWNEDQRIISSMKLCWRFCNGEQCPFGMRCHFRHEGPAKFRKNFVTSTGRNESGGFSRIDSEQLECKALVKPSLDAIEVSQKPVYWKTRLCNKWEATGNCPYGISCGFAHGHAGILNGLMPSLLNYVITVDLDLSNQLLLFYSNTSAEIVHETISVQGIFHVKKTKGKLQLHLRLTSMGS